VSFIQNEFDKEHGEVNLAPGEYEGPLIISHPCVVDGGNATIWAQSGPVISINASGVTIKNLRVEIASDTPQSDNSVAVLSSAGDTAFENVEVKGSVEGIRGEQDQWSAPSLISIGDFAANKQNTFTYEISVPVEAVLECKLKDVEISPTKLFPGKNVLLIKTANMRDNTILYGEILLKTVVNRRIYLLGWAKKDAVEHNERLPITGSLPISEPVQINLPDIIIAPSIPDDQNIQLLDRGQRITLSEGETRILKIVFEQEDSSQNADIDPYVFRVGRNGKVFSDDDLVFFGNPEPATGDVKVTTDSTQTMAIIDLTKAKEEIDKYVVCFSIYEESRKDFSNICKPRVRLINGGKDIYRFILDDLSREKTVVALEIYRYKGAWKVNAVGRGYQSGLAQLCESYGVNVE